MKTRQASCPVKDSPTGLSFYTFQQTAYEKTIENLFTKNYCGTLLTAPTGHGKTPLALEVARYCLRSDWIKDLQARRKGHTYFTKVLYIGPASVLTQTRRKAWEMHGLKHMSTSLMCFSYGFLSSQFGRMFITPGVKMVGGELVEFFRWNTENIPALIIFDESQYLMRQESNRSRVAVDGLCNTLEEFYLREHYIPCKILHLSATPFARISEARYFALHCRIPHQYGVVKQALIPKTWPTFAQDMAGQRSNPQDYCVEAIKRLVDYTGDYIVRVPYQDCGDRWQIQLVHFRDEKDKEEYQNAYEDYLKKLEARGEELKGFEIFHIIREFCKAAEWLRVDYIAEAMFNSYKAGKAPCAAVIFKQSLCRLKMLLIEKYNIDESLIATVWGGLTDRQVKAELEKKLAEEERDIRESGDVSYEDEEDEESNILLDDNGDDKNDNDIPEYLRLKSQSMKERQQNIDDFQSGKKLFMIHTFAAGGVGIDLPHDKEQLRPREVFLGLIFSDKQFLQANREARITSRSETPIIIMLYAETIEEQRVFPKLMAKLACLRQMLGAKKSFASVLVPIREIADRLEEQEKKVGESTKELAEVGEILQLSESKEIAEQQEQEQKPLQIFTNQEQLELAI